MYFAVLEEIDSITMLVSSFNLLQSFNYMPYLFYKKTVHFRDQFFLYMDLGQTDTHTLHMIFVLKTNMRRQTGDERCEKRSSAQYYVHHIFVPWANFCKYQVWRRTVSWKYRCHWLFFLKQNIKNPLTWMMSFCCFFLFFTKRVPHVKSRKSLRTAAPVRSKAV